MDGMNERRRLSLRKRYLKLTREYEKIYDSYSCGRQLAEHINPRLSEIHRELDEISEEVQKVLYARTEASV